MSSISRLKWATGNTLTLVLLLALSLFLSPPTFASGGLVQLSSDPYTNKGSQHKTEVEPDNFSYGSAIVNAFQVGRFAGGGSSNVGWATSSDGGSTWNNGFLPGTTVFATPKGPYVAISDPSVAYDAAHTTWLISTLAITNNHTPTILISRSTDGGLTWANPVSVVKPKNADLDKNWIVCDTTANSPYYGHCYSEWDDNGHGNTIYMSTSTDGGNTWGVAKTTANRAHGIGGQPLVQPAGKVIVPIGNGSDDHILSFTSSDGGASWSNTVLISSANSYFENANFRSGPLPSADIDASGKVYVVWEDCRFEKGCNSNDLVMSTSSDGTTWSAVQRIPIDSVGSHYDHFIPGIGVDHSTSGSTTHIGLAYYYFPVASCPTKKCKLYVGYISSTDGGSTWSTTTMLAGPMSLLWIAATDSGRMVGDYISTAVVNGKAFPVFASATAPNNGIYNENIFSIVGGLSIVGGKITSHADRILVSASPTRTRVRTAH